MPKATREEVERETALITKLIDVDNLTDHQIIQQLQISEATFYRYKQRIKKKVAAIWEKENKSAVKYREAKFAKTLEDCYLLNKKIAENTNMPPMARIEASKTMVTCQAQLAKLSRDGPVFNPSLPVSVNAKEITV